MRRVLASLALLAAAGAARAHEFWIEPSRYEPAPGELVKLRLFVGENLEGEGVPRNEVWIDRFDAIRAGTPARIAGLDGSDPAGLVRPDREGPIVVAYASVPTYIEIDPAKFETYLEADGLDAPKAARAKSGASGSPGRERFSRCAKALLSVGGRSGMSVTKPAGLTLELVPESDPHTLKPGDPLTVRLWYLGKPLAAALVKARDRVQAAEPIEIRTDASGRATLRLPRAGRWLIHAVHMTAARGDPRADWESFWASLTFDIPPGS
jgi:uncharacterized GH25 family protein